MKRTNLELTVGLFLILGIACFSYLAIVLGDVAIFDDDTYMLRARFQSSSGLKEGSPVEIAGVAVGKVTDISFDPEEYLSVVELTVPRDVKIQEDATASIRSTGIIGSTFVKISPGGSEDYLEAGMEILETESSVSIEELISKYIFESK